MNYQNLFNELSQNPPIGWRAVHCVPNPQGGVYLWPTIRPEIIEVAGTPPDGRLENHSILFEFHVTENDYARILARARFHGTQPEADSRWAAWRHLAIDHCLARPVQESGDPQSTKAVGKWDGGDFRLIKFNPPPDEQAVAQIIRSYLKNSPRSLLCFIANL